MNKILRVNMTDLTAKMEDGPEKYKLIGGRGLTSAIICNEVPPSARISSAFRSSDSWIFLPKTCSSMAGTSAPPVE